MVVCFFYFFVALSGADKQRLVSSDMNNLLSWEAEINIAAQRYHVPEWIIAGTLFNESNFRPLRRGGNYGHGQINCRIWLAMLVERGIAHTCDDLFHPWVSIHATAFVLSYLSKQKRAVKKGAVDWRAVLTYYRRGGGWSKYDLGYYNRVYFYGKNVRSYWTNRSYQWCKI